MFFVFIIIILLIRFLFTVSLLWAFFYCRKTKGRNNEYYNNKKFSLRHKKEYTDEKELERKMKNIDNYGYSQSYFEKEMQGVVAARVTAVHRERFEVVSHYGISYAKLKIGVYYNDTDQEFPTTGDFVLVKYNSQGDSQIVKTAARKSCFKRKNPEPGVDKEQVVAANFDYVFIMSSLNHDLNYKRMDRYLALSWQSGAIPVILLTKADLVTDYKEALWKTKEMAVGAQVIAVSIKTGEGIDALKKYLEPKKTVVFLGSSGVGKSSLVNYLEGEEIMAVKTIREDDSKGRHTTSHRQLVMLKSGAMVIDTPGMRELGMWDASQGLGQTFGDIEEYFAECKFRNCTHISEPGCAVQKALEDKEISAERWESYKKLKQETKFVDEKTQFLKEKRQREKNISKLIRNINKDKR